MGPNGCGKSTILHALACINKPAAKERPNYKFSQFFTPTTDNRWQHSSFTISQDCYDRGQLVTDKETNFHKGEGRWMPHYDRRAERYITYIGVYGSVPQIELEKKESLITFTSSPLKDNSWLKVKEIAGIVLNRNYDELNMYKASGSKEYLGVRMGSVKYSSLSMGAGEQRVFHIIEALVKAKKGGLILIEEIELLLHEDALSRLLDELQKLAIDKNLQIIFSHSPNIVSKNYIAIRYIFQTPEQTYCLTSITDEGMRRLTGKQVRPVKVYVEDDLAKALVNRIAADNGMRKLVEVNNFGASKNLFTLLCGKLLQGEDLSKSLFVLDGDVYRSEDEKKDLIQKLLVGNDSTAASKRVEALNHIRQFTLPDNTKPEPYYNRLICSMDEGSLTDEEKEIKDCCERIVHPADSHYYIDNLIQDFGMEKSVGYATVAGLLHKHTEWSTITKDINDWLLEHKPV